MSLEIEGALFDVGAVEVSEGAAKLAMSLQRRFNREGQEAVYVHTSLLLKLHATGQYGAIPRSDRILNKSNIQKGKGRVLSVIGARKPFVVITHLDEASPRTWIGLPEET